MRDLIDRNAVLRLPRNVTKNLSGEVVEETIDVDRIKNLQPFECIVDGWCTDCGEYDAKNHRCPRFNRVIREAVEEIRNMEKPERKKGKWIFDGDCFICSECESAFNWWAHSQCSNFCPNCGADMRGEQDG